MSVGDEIRVPCDTEEPGGRGLLVCRVAEETRGRDRRGPNEKTAEAASPPSPPPLPDASGKRGDITAGPRRRGLGKGREPLSAAPTNGGVEELQPAARHRPAPASGRGVAGPFAALTALSFWGAAPARTPSGASPAPGEGRATNGAEPLAPPAPVAPARVAPDSAPPPARSKRAFCIRSSVPLGAPKVPMGGEEDRGPRPRAIMPGAPAPPPVGSTPKPGPWARNPRLLLGLRQHREPPSCSPRKPASEGPSESHRAFRGEYPAPESSPGGSSAPRWGREGAVPEAGLLLSPFSALRLPAS